MKNKKEILFVDSKKTNEEFWPKRILDQLKAGGTVRIMNYQRELPWSMGWDTEQLYEYFDE